LKASCSIEALRIRQKAKLEQARKSQSSLNPQDINNNTRTRLHPRWGKGEGRFAWAERLSTFVGRAPPSKLNWGNKRFGPWWIYNAPGCTTWTEPTVSFPEGEGNSQKIERWKEIRMIWGIWPGKDMNAGHAKACGKERAEKKPRNWAIRWIQQWEKETPYRRRKPRPWRSRIRGAKSINWANENAKKPAASAPSTGQFVGGRGQFNFSSRKSRCVDKKPAHSGKPWRCGGKRGEEGEYDQKVWPKGGFTHVEARPPASTERVPFYRGKLTKKGKRKRNLKAVPEIGN